jgi:hypothetical protein
VPGTRHQRRAYLSGRQLCGPWQHKPLDLLSKGPIIIECIIGTVTIIGIVIITGAVTIIGIIIITGAVTVIGIDTIIGAHITVATIITTGIHIIGKMPGQKIT